MSSLVEYCHLSQGFCRKVGEVLDFPGEDSAKRPKELEECLDSLKERTKSPEVRILVLGPLKAGKSTLMNVLIDNPFVSQISQLPAYPCRVEVRDLERDENNHPTQNEQTILHCKDGSIETLSPDKGRLRLDKLLNEYINCGSVSTVDYNLIEQRIDLSTQQNSMDLQGLDLVLIDSPGLFFQKRLDKEVFGFSSSEELDENKTSEYSKTAQSLISQSDIVLFVIRWEQLFFHVVADYLKRFRQAVLGNRHVKTFVVVNATSQGRTQEGKEIKVYDQLAEVNQKSLRYYFEKHVADDELVGMLHTGNQMSLEFCDLLEVAKSLFETQSENDGKEEGKSVEVIRKIRGYIFSKELLEKKKDGLRKLTDETSRLAIDYLEEQMKLRRDEIEKFEDEISKTSARMETEKNILREVQKEAVQVKNELEERKNRQALLSKKNFGDIGYDGPTAAYLNLVKHLRNVDLSIENDTLEIRKRIESIYNMWVNGELGKRTLRNLALRLWQDTTISEQKPESLQQVHIRRASIIFKKFVQYTRDMVLENEIQSVSQNLKSEYLSESKPAVIVEAQKPREESRIPLLSFDRQTILSGFCSWIVGKPQWPRVGPKSLWGWHGQREILKNKEVEILKGSDFRRSVRGQIWGEPWNFLEYFETDVLRESLLIAFEDLFCSAWVSELKERIENTQQRLVRLQDEVKKQEDAIQKQLDLRNTYECEIKSSEDLIRELEERKNQITRLCDDNLKQLS